MQENNFEKKVQQKMMDLHINPSNAVWLVVQDGIEKKRTKRRRIVVFWCLLITLLGTSVIILKNELANKNIATIENNGNGNSKVQSNIKDERKLYKVDKGNHQKLNISRYKVTERKLSSNNIKANGTMNVDKNFPNILIDGTETTSKTNKENKLGIQHNRKVIAANTTVLMSPIETFSNQYNNSVPINEISKLSIKLQIIALAKKKHLHIPIESSINLINLTKLIELKKDNKLLLNTSVKDKRKAETVKRKLSIAYSFGIGKTAAASNYLGSSLNYERLDAGFSQNNSGTPDSNNRNFKHPSNVKPGIGFNGGIAIIKNISTNTKISIGLNYNLISTSNKVGQSVTNLDSSKSFKVGSSDVYNNYAHFIQVPIDFSTKLTRFKQHNIFFNGGLSINQLLHSNMLQFNAVNQQYAINNNLLNKTILGFSGGFSINLAKNNKGALLFGPSFYYSISPVANKGFYSNSHYSFLGFKLQKEINFK